jgi:hypothetical protein
MLQAATAGDGGEVVGGGVVLLPPPLHETVSSARTIANRIPAIIRAAIDRQRALSISSS